ncbi:hypothetical protein D869_gp189 [Caulobacter phage CcrRogue]|uniref:Uncharacterized protein n=1 Tax=Caulobacter phage CcrRogue TaxID=2927986 RepID=K4JR08_9CAUD|nr:hypothetical protein D869_gp189 [Caulobacter phage CcrRogue]AFU86725.1 hypothetical protein CcrRogue_gp243 [Caulobacter phage CcrRogue]
MTHELIMVQVGGQAHSHFSIETREAEVPGGKLYITTAHAGENCEAISVAQTFVPTPPPSKVVTIPDEVLRDLMSRKDVASGRSLLKKWLFAHGLELEA